MPMSSREAPVWACSNRHDTIIVLCHLLHRMSFIGHGAPPMAAHVALLHTRSAYTYKPCIQRKNM